jgi:hypothetical protein
MAGFTELTRRLMADRGISVRGLARIVHYDDGGLGRIIRGLQSCPPYLARAIDDALQAEGKIIAAAREQQQAGSVLKAARDVSDLTGHAVAFTAWAETANAGDGTLQLLDEQVNGIAREYLASPPLPLIQRAAEVSRTVYGLLQQRQRLRHERDLYLTAAKAHAFLAWAAGNLGQLAAAAVHGRTALTLAGEAGHRGAQALALCALSKTAYWDGQRGAALDLAKRGYEASPPNSTRALLACQVADAADPADAAAAITAARDALGGADAKNELGGVFSCGPTRIANYAIGVHLRAGNPAAALAAAAAIGQEQPGEQVGYGTRGQIAIGCATARLVQHDVSGAMQEISPVFALPPEQRLVTVTGRLADLADACDVAAISGGGPEAAGMASQIRSYCHETAATAAALPPGKEPS